MAYTLNRRLAQLVDSNGQLNTGKIPNDYITSDHVADNTITSAMLHTSFTVSTSNLTAIDTDDVSEGSSNLYYTNARADARIAAATTDDLTEGSSNLYFTNARVDARLLGNQIISNHGIVADNDGNKVELTTDGAIEITRTAGSPYIDFKDSTSDDYDQRIQVSSGNFNFTASGLSIAGSEFIDNSRNIDIGSGTISSGAITSTGEVEATALDINGNGDISGNLTLGGYLAGPATFTIDPAAVGDNTGTVVIAGNLQVDGTTTTINSTTVNVDDLNIQLATGAANAAAANGAGITVDGASATITYDGTNDEWDFNKDINVTGSATVSGTVITPMIASADGTQVISVPNTGEAIFYRGAVFNESSYDSDFRVESNNNTHMLFVDAGNDRVGIGTSSLGTNSVLDVYGGALQIFNSGATAGTTADATLHIKGQEPTQNRLTQISAEGTSQRGLNLMASTDGNDAHQWWAWGVDTDDEFKILHGTDFSDSLSGIRIQNTGNLVMGNLLYFNNATDSSSIANTSGSLYLNSDSSMYLRTYAGGWQTRVFIADGGNVGIGETNPTMGLHVADTKGVLFGPSGSGASTYISPNHENTINGGYGLDTDTGDVWINYRGYQNGTSRFRDFRVGNGKEGLIALFDGSSGYLGLGLSSAAPSKLLHLQRTAPTSVGTPDADTMILLDHDGDQYIEFRTTGTNTGTMQGNLFTDNGVVGFIGYKQYTSVGVNGNYGESIHIGLRDFSGTDQYSGIYLGNTAADVADGVNSPHMFIKSGSGNVGIGTVTPAKNLEIFGSGDESGILVKNDTNTNYRGIYFGATESDNTSYGKIHMIPQSGQLNITSGYSGWGGFITFHTNGSERMHIGTSGNVGIGYTTPYSRLWVEKEGISLSDFSFEDASSIAHLTLAGSNSHVRMHLGTMDVSPYGVYIQGGYDNTPDASGTGNSGTEPLLLNPLGGDVGIGTSSTPATKLQVSGGNISIDGDQEIHFLTQSTATAYGKIYASDYPSKGYTSSGSGSTVLNRFWPTISSAGGVFLILNTDGGAGSAENAFDSFVVWQGNRDGDKLLKVSNTGNTSTRRLSINSAASESHFIPNGSGLNRVDLMLYSYASGEHHGQVIACDNNGEAHLMMVDSANTPGTDNPPGTAGGWGLDIYYSGDTSYPYNLRTGQSGTWTHREKIHFDGTREFMNTDVQHNDSYKSLQWKWVTTPYYWYAATTNNVSTSIAYNGFTTNGNSTMPSNIKALYVTYYYHISGYGTGSVGQGDHASDIWGPDAPSGTTSWSFTTSGNVDWGSAVFMHDGDASESGDMLYYGAWFPGAIIPVNSNGSIYGLLSHGYSGGTHYHHMYVWGYAT